MKQRTKSTLILLLLTFSIAARAQTAVTTENISGEHFKPYANKWKMYAVDAEGKENLVTIWTDYAQLIELEGTTYISRVQELYNPGMHLRELWTNLFEYETLLPYRASQFKTSGDLTYTEFENGKINHASKPAAQEKSQTVYGTGSVYDWSMYGVLLSGLPFKKGEVYSIPVFSQQNDSGKGNIIATVQGQETVADDDSKNHLCWKIDTNTGLTFWVTKKAPYVIQLSYPTPAGGKMIWRMYQ